MIDWNDENVDPWDNRTDPWDESGESLKNENDIFNSIQRSRMIGDFFGESSGRGILGDAAADSMLAQDIASGIISTSGRTVIRRKGFMRKAVSGLWKPARQDGPCSKRIDKQTGEC